MFASFMVIIYFCSYLEMQFGLRLVDGPSDNEGRLEVQISGVWGTVCNDSWSHDDADVACRQLGFSGASIPNISPSIPGTGLPILLDNVNCNGSEAFIWDCPNEGIGEHNCAHNEDVHLLCVPNGTSTDPNSLNFVIVLLFQLSACIGVASMSYVGGQVLSRPKMQVGMQSMLL